jgi:replicative DNA helicase
MGGRAATETKREVKMGVGKIGKNKSGVNSVPVVFYDREAEQASLGAMLFDERFAADGIEALSVDHFHDEGHRKVFQAVASLIEKDIDVDFVTLRSELENRGDLNTVGGATYLAEIFDVVPTIPHHSHYFRILKEKKFRRDLKRFAIETESDIQDLTLSPEDLLSLALERIHKIDTSYRKPRLLAPEEVLCQTMEIMDAAHQKKESVVGYSTGLTDLDSVMLGLRPRKYYVIAGRTSMGKTALGIQIAENMASQGAHVLFFSLEMDATDIQMRQIARHAQVNLIDILTGQLSEQDWKKVTEAAARISKFPFYIDDRTRTIEDITAIIKREKLRGKCDAVFIDYIGLLNTRRRLPSRYAEVSLFSHTLQALSRQLDICVVGLAQLNRAVENRMPPKPRLSDLKESGEIEQDADGVILLYRPEFYFIQENPVEPRGEVERQAYWEERGKIQNLCQVFVAKLRYGKTAVVELNFFGESQQFTDRHGEETLSRKQGEKHEYQV